ncbi:MAG TPA: DNA polymerase [Candidatus Nanoarchaeia archaeon]|nr:DNA polymerase [Candidatus Nanoarchaeia archaeon]
MRTPQQFYYDLPHLLKSTFKEYKYKSYEKEKQSRRDKAKINEKAQESYLSLLGFEPTEFHFDEEPSVCDGCPFYKDAKYHKFSPSYGSWFNLNAVDSPIEFIFITDKGALVQHVGKALMLTKGNDGQNFIQALNDLEMTNYAITSIHLCRGESSKFNKDASNHCRPYLENFIMHITELNANLGAEPPILILCGNNAIEQVTKKKLKVDGHLNTKFESKDYNFLPELNLSFYITYHPSFFNPGTKFYDELKIQLFMDSMENRLIGFTPDIPKGTYKIIDNINDFKSLMLSMKQSELLSTDIETSGFNYKEFITIKDKKRKGYKEREYGSHKDFIIGISFSNKHGEGFYVPLYVKGKILKEYVDHDPELAYLEDEQFYFIFGDDIDEVISLLKDLLEDEKIKKVLHNGKFDATFLQVQFGIVIKNFYCDTMIMTYIINENKEKSLDFLSARYPDLAGYKNEVYSNLTEEKKEVENYSDIGLNKLGIYGAKDADATLRIFNEGMEEIDKLEKKYHGAALLKQYLFDFYMPLQKHYMDAEIEGVYFDREYATRTAEEYKDRMEELEENIFKQVKPIIPEPLDESGKLFNINSSNQLKIVLFEKLDFEPVKPTNAAIDKGLYKKSKGKYNKVIDSDDASTDQDTLKQLLEFSYNKVESISSSPEDKEEYQLRATLLEDILEYKKKAKMINTYLEGKKLLSRLDESTNRLHFSMKVVGTTSGRLSSTPNVQNLPKKTPKSNIRGIFAPPSDEYKFFSADLSQAELRLMADHAQDFNMLDDIEAGRDIHWMAALDLFYHGQNLEYDSKDPQMKRYRKLTKLCNFGGLYGGSDDKKVSSINEKLERGEEKVDLTLAADHSKWFWSRYHRTAEFQSEVRDFALSTGFLISKLGRIRRLPEVNSTNNAAWEEAFRQGINSIIQGAASDIAQCGFMRIREYFKDNQLKSCCLFTVHDEADGYLHVNEIDMLKPIIPNLMVVKDTKWLPLDRIKVKLESELEIFKNRFGE